MSPALAFAPRLKAMLDLAPALPKASRGQPRLDAMQSAGRRVLLLQGCVQSVLAPEINAATTRLLARLGVEAVTAKAEGCCGALNHHLGQEAQALGHARRLIDEWMAHIDKGGVEAILITASGCGTVIRDYAHMFAEDPDYREKARLISALARDVSEYLQGFDLELEAPESLRVAYHSACSLQHGQKITEEPKSLLRRAGFDVVETPEGHLCCGSAGTYNMLQPEIAEALKRRKVANIESTKPDVIATGNIGCISQIGSGTSIPIVHMVQLLDWAAGGEKPFP
jgi:glycolate oxidase iron-sulfur subunit